MAVRRRIRLLAVPRSPRQCALKRLELFLQVVTVTKTLAWILFKKPQHDGFRLRCDVRTQ